MDFFSLPSHLSHGLKGKAMGDLRTIPTQPTTWRSRSQGFSQHHPSNINLHQVRTLRWMSQVFFSVLSHPNPWHGQDHGFFVGAIFLNDIYFGAITELPKTTPEINELWSMFNNTFKSLFSNITKVTGCLWHAAIEVSTFTVLKQYYFRIERSVRLWNFLSSVNTFF